MAGPLGEIIRDGDVDRKPIFGVGEQSLATGQPITPFEGIAFDAQRDRYFIPLRFKDIPLGLGIIFFPSADVSDNGTQASVGVRANYKDEQQLFILSQYRMRIKIGEWESKFDIKLPPDQTRDLGRFMRRADLFGKSQIGEWEIVTDRFKPEDLAGLEVEIEDPDNGLDMEGGVEYGPYELTRDGQHLWKLLRFHGVNGSLNQTLQAEPALDLQFIYNFPEDLKELEGHLVRIEFSNGQVAFIDPTATLIDFDSMEAIRKPGFVFPKGKKRLAKGHILGVGRATIEFPSKGDLGVKVAIDNSEDSQIPQKPN